LASLSPLWHVAGKAAVPAPSRFQVILAGRPAAEAGQRGISLSDLLTEYAGQELRGFACDYRSHLFVRGDRTPSFGEVDVCQF
jgi:hypothetical protein